MIIKKNYQCFDFNAFAVILILLLILFVPSKIFAANEPLNSANYQINGQTDFSGGASKSENYSVNGILTDIKDVESQAEPAETLSPIPIQPALPPKIAETKSIWNSISDFIKLLTDFTGAKEIFSALTGLAGILGLVSLLSSSLLSMPWLNIFANFWSRIPFLFGWGKKRRKWGIVYEAESNQPIPMAAVRIFEYTERKLLATNITDKEGRYEFLVEPGKYYIDVIKQDYLYPSKLVYRDYHREMFEIRDKDMTVNLDIPMDPDIQKLGAKINVVSKIIDFANMIRIPILVIGTILSISFYFKSSVLANFLYLVFYLILWILEWIELKKIRTYGVVSNFDNSMPVPLTIVRLLDAKTGKIVATKVSTNEGKYFQLVNPGVYNLIATKENYDQYKISDLSFRRGDILAKDIQLKSKE